MSTIALVAVTAFVCFLVSFAVSYVEEGRRRRRLRREVSE